jgi:hypothetical protein
VRPPLALLPQTLPPSAKTLGSRKPYMHTDTTMLASGRPKSEVDFHDGISPAGDDAQDFT